MIFFKICFYITGEVLSEINTNNMNNSHGAVSPCGRFVASSGNSNTVAGSPLQYVVYVLYFTLHIHVLHVLFCKVRNSQNSEHIYELPER